MLELTPTEARDVHCRIGSSENVERWIEKDQLVHCRIGSSESHQAHAPWH